MWLKYNRWIWRFLYFFRTPLHLAAENEDKDTLQILLDSGKFDVNQEDRLHIYFFLFQTPMHIAAKTGNSDVIGSLLHIEKVDLNSFT